MPNFFGFQNLQELRNALNDPKVIYDYAGTGLPISLYESHHTSTFPLESPFILAWSEFLRETDFPRVLSQYNGSAVINDGLDGVLPKPRVLGICRKKSWPYIKQQQMLPQYLLRYENRYHFAHLVYYLWFRLQGRKNTQLSPYSPTRQSLWYAGEFDTDPERERPIDILFVGHHNQHRRKVLGEYQDIAEKLNLNTVITDKRFSRSEYFKMMTQAKICLSFVGSGPRARREWEIMLAGSLLLNDAFLNKIWGGELPLMRSDEHFIWQNPNNRKAQIEQLIEACDNRIQIARSGHELAHTCFFMTPTVELRLIHALFSKPDFRWDGTLSSIVQLEHCYDIGWPQPPVRTNFNGDY